MFGHEETQTVQSFAYEIKGDSAVILRCFSRDTRAEIPERIEGHPVTELGAYAFSAHFGEEKLSEALRAGRARLYVPEMPGIIPGQPDAAGGSTVFYGDETAVPQALHGDCQGESAVLSELSGNCRGRMLLPQALCGERLEEITLPPTVRGVGRYCFYDCGNLRWIEFHGGLSDWGSGAFTGCHRVRKLRVYTDVDGRSHLKDVLDELREELEVEYLISGKTDRSAEGYGQAVLIFPEFYEEGVENTPARILETHVHGSGILYRNCFQGRIFDFAQYDTLFPHAKAWESGELVLRMALCRLRGPQGLTRRAEEQYEAYLAEHAEEAGKWLLGRHDLEGVRFLLERMRDRLSGGRAALRAGNRDETEGKTGDALQDVLETALLEEASRIQYMEAVSFLMERLGANRAGRPAHRRRLEL